MSEAVLFQNMPPLSPQEYADLEDSIRKNGILYPILIDEDGVVIDGHHRKKIAEHLGIKCPSQTITGKTDAEKRTMAFTANVDRRHLTQEQRRGLLAESLKADPQLSDREHGRRVGMSPTTVGTVRAELEESVQIGHFPSHTDPRTGRASQPATKPRPEPENEMQVQERRREALELARQGWNKSEIAAKQGVSEYTTRKDLEVVLPEGEILPGRFLASDGKWYPVKRPSSNPRHEEILNLTRQGRSNEEIAERTGNDVKYVYNLLRDKGRDALADRAKLERLDRMTDTLSGVVAVLETLTELPPIEPDKASEWATEYRAAEKAIKDVLTAIRNATIKGAEQ